MKTLPLLISATFMMMFNCTNSPKLDYKYADKENPIQCSDVSIDINLLKEAVYSFEDDIIKLPAKQTTLARGYSQISRYTVPTRLSIPQEKISEHSRKVFEVLKQEPDLWAKTDDRYHLNYKHPLVTCISDNIQDKNLKTTFNALLTTHSMSSQFIGPPIQSKISTAVNDKYLATFIALDSYYSRFFTMDFSKKKSDEPLVPLEKKNYTIEKSTQPKQ